MGHPTHEPLVNMRAMHDPQKKINRAMILMLTNLPFTVNTRLPS